MPPKCCKNNDTTTDGQYVVEYNVYEIISDVSELKALNSHENNCAS